MFFNTCSLMPGLVRLFSNNGSTMPVLHCLCSSIAMPSMQNLLLHYLFRPSAMPSLSCLPCNASSDMPALSSQPCWHEQNGILSHVAHYSTLHLESHSRLVLHIQQVNNLLKYRNIPIDIKIYVVLDPDPYSE